MEQYLNHTESENKPETPNQKYFNLVREKYAGKEVYQEVPLIENGVGLMIVDSGRHHSPTAILITPDRIIATEKFQPTERGTPPAEEYRYIDVNDFIQTPGESSGTFLSKLDGAKEILEMNSAKHTRTKNIVIKAENGKRCRADLLEVNDPYDRDIVKSTIEHKMGTSPDPLAGLESPSAGVYIVPKTAPPERTIDFTIDDV